MEQSELPESQDCFRNDKGDVIIQIERRRSTGSRHVNSESRKSQRSLSNENVGHNSLLNSVRRNSIEFLNSVHAALTISKPENSRKHSHGQVIRKGEHLDEYFHVGNDADYQKEPLSDVLILGIEDLEHEISTRQRKTFASPAVKSPFLSYEEKKRLVFEKYANSD